MLDMKKATGLQSLVPGMAGVLIVGGSVLAWHAISGSAPGVHVAAIMFAAAFGVLSSGLLQFLLLKNKKSQGVAAVLVINFIMTAAGVYFLIQRLLL